MKQVLRARQVPYTILNLTNPVQLYTHYLCEYLPYNIGVVCLSYQMLCDTWRCMLPTSLFPMYG